MSDIPAGYKLIETGTLVQFEVTERQVGPSSDEGNSVVRLELQLGSPEGEDADGGDGEDQAEWGSFGLIFTLAVVSFADARPRGVSGIEFVEEDEFTVDDLITHLRFVRGELHFYADYLRGRCVKTSVTVRRDGHVTLETVNRGEAVLRWVDALKGKKHLRPVE